MLNWVSKHFESLVNVTHVIPEHLSKDWKSPVYAFYEPILDITYINGCHVHEFKCTEKPCNFKSHWYLDSKSKASTGNMIKHVRTCWGDNTWNAASQCHGVKEACEEVVKPLTMNGSITVNFKCTGKGKITYSHCQHMKTETKLLMNSNFTPVLHPQHKLDYFHQAGWKLEWISMARSLVKETFEHSYKVFSAADESLTEDLDMHSESKAENLKNIFDCLLSLKKPSKSKAICDELQLYLSTPPESSLKPLQWWHEKRKVYPQLHCMALDYLSILATSVDVKHLFSHGCLILSHTCSCLSLRSTQALLCLESWSLAGLVKDKDVEVVAILDEVSSQMELDRLANMLSKTCRG
ncbi:hypothetical protein AN958_08094 [Leucoagaricus sp. SymC.cos]|nr:hypothetical protein AN958_08094 [Leucoagaricus sp. SymC.cos]